MNLNIKSLKPDSPQLHTFLFKIMEKVKKETGFNPFNGQILVEASPVGDCVEIIVTKISDNVLKPKNKKNIKSVKATIKPKTSSNLIYIFDTFDNMCNALLELSEYTLQKSCCYEINKNYVLSTSEISDRERSVLKEYIIDSDIGKYTDSFLKEHAKEIASNEKLVSMAKGICKLNANK